VGRTIGGGCACSWAVLSRAVARATRKDHAPRGPLRTNLPQGLKLAQTDLTADGGRGNPQESGRISDRDAALRVGRVMLLVHSASQDTRLRVP
jgi:hypothetical protein